MKRSNDCPNFEYFEELCALAAIGQVSEMELVEVQEHIQNCAQCRESHGIFIDLIHNKLPLADPELESSRRHEVFPESSSYRDRFLTRARKQGLPVSGSVLAEVSLRSKRNGLFYQFSYGHAAAAAIAILVVSASILGVALRESNARYNALASKMAAINKPGKEEVHPASSTVTEVLQVDSPHNPGTVFRPARTSPSVAETNIELAQAQLHLADANARAKELEEKLRMVTDERDDVNSRRVRESNDAKERLAAAEQDRDEAVRARRTALDAQTYDQARIVNQANQIQQLRVALNTAAGNQERENVLFAKQREVREQLFNMRIADVHDVDSRGRESRASARVFYTDGKSKSLLFLAFGLGGRADGQKYVFQVWGASGLGTASARSLGTFDIDDPKTDLWALSVDDPSKLAGIDSVFVTVEKAGGSEKPTAKQIMYAYLPQVPVKH